MPLYRIVCAFWGCGRLSSCYLVDEKRVLGSCPSHYAFVELWVRRYEVLGYGVAVLAAVLVGWLCRGGQ